MNEFVSVKTISLFLTKSEAFRLLDQGYIYFYGTYADVISVTKDITSDFYWVKLQFLDEVYPLHD